MTRVYNTQEKPRRCQPPELAKAVETEVIDYEGYEEFPRLFLSALGAKALAARKINHDVMISTYVK